LNLALALKARGHEVLFACSPLPFDAVDALEKRARERGLEPVTRFRLAKHFSLRDNFADARDLPPWLKAQGIEIVHCHRRQDHWVAGRAARRCGIPVVRSLHDGTPLAGTLRDRWLTARATDRLLYASAAAKACDQTRHSWAEGFALTLPPAVDLDRYSPQGLGNLRAELGIPEGAVVIGIAARVQEKRRFDLLLGAFQRVLASLPEIRLLIIGRGTRLDEVARKPAERLGISHRLVFAGYRREDYRQALNTMDFQIFLVPGSDGSCRALREALALGKPAVTTRRGMIPEIVHDGDNGVSADETVESLAAALVRLGSDAGLRSRMGAAARQRALREYALTLQAERTEAVYRDLGLVSTTPPPSRA